MGGGLGKPALHPQLAGVRRAHVPALRFEEGDFSSKQQQPSSARGGISASSHQSKSN